MGKPSTSNNGSRYAGYTEDELDGAIAWMRSQGRTVWVARFKREDGWAKIETNGMPQVIRQMLRDQFEAIELMTSDQVRRLFACSIEERVHLVGQVLTEAER